MQGQEQLEIKLCYMQQETICFLLTVMTIFPKIA